MATYIGEIRMFAGLFAPQGWFFCDGRLLPIPENDVLFSLIGTTFGGDGRTTFAVPDLRGRIPVHMGTGYVLGETGGSETVTLNANQIPAHTHLLAGTAAAATHRNPRGGLFGATERPAYASSGAATVPMAPLAVGPSGGSQSHDNLQPYLCISFIIAAFGVYPSPT